MPNARIKKNQTRDNVLLTKKIHCCKSVFIESIYQSLPKLLTDGTNNSLAEQINSIEKTQDEKIKNKKDRKKKLNQGQYISCLYIL